MRSIKKTSFCNQSGSVLIRRYIQYLLYTLCVFSALPFKAFSRVMHVNMAIASIYTKPCKYRDSYLCRDACLWARVPRAVYCYDTELYWRRLLGSQHMYTLVLRHAMTHMATRDWVRCSVRTHEMRDASPDIMTALIGWHYGQHPRHCIERVIQFVSVCGDVALRRIVYQLSPAVIREQLSGSIISNHPFVDARMESGCSCKQNHHSLSLSLFLSAINTQNTQTHCTDIIITMTITFHRTMWWHFQEIHRSHTLFLEPSTPSNLPASWSSV